jgi:hypothetical protein
MAASICCTEGGPVSLVEASLAGIGERFACTGGIRHPLGRRMSPLVTFATLVNAMQRADTPTGSPPQVVRVSNLLLALAPLRVGNQGAFRGGFRLHRLC